MDSTKFMHMQLGAGHITLAVRAMPDEVGAYVVGAAFCSPKDQFSKKKGRLIAEGRLTVGKVFCCVTLQVVNG